MTTVPRGRTISSARRRPSGRPVTSTTTSKRSAGATRFDRRGCRESELTRDRELVLVATEHRDVRRGRPQHLRDEQPHPAVSDDGDALCRSSIVICSRIRQAAATGSTNTAVSSSTVSGTACRLPAGSVTNSANAPSRPRMPRTFRLEQCSFSFAGAPRASSTADVDLADDALADPREHRPRARTRRRRRTRGRECLRSRRSLRESADPSRRCRPSARG